MDPTEAKARKLHEFLSARGVTCFVHWDRSPWGVRIPLVDLPTGDDFGEYLPSLYVLTEGTQTVAGKDNTWLWIGQLGNFADAQMDVLYDTGFRWIERHWAGAHTASVADMIVPLLDILRHGAASAQAKWEQ